MNFDMPSSSRSIIKVIGVGGGGSNAVNHMYRQGIKDVDFVVINTDAQALAKSPVPNRIQIGSTLKEGRGAGNNPDIGRQAAIENMTEIVSMLENNTKMVFITAGMGGGTGTGAAPVIAKVAKDMGVLTVGIVTLPFRFEGRIRMDQAIQGMEELAKYVDSLLVINNEKLREIYGNLKISDAFSRADNILSSAAKGISEIITVPGYINVDFEDVRTIMADSRMAILGSASAEGESRALNAIKEAIHSPLLNNNDIKGANNILLHITSGTDEATMDEITEITDYLSRLINPGALIIWGTGTDVNLEDKLNVTIIATGFENSILNEWLNLPFNGEKKFVNSISINNNEDNSMAESPVYRPIKKDTIILIDDEMKIKTENTKIEEVYQKSDEDKGQRLIRTLKQTEEKLNQSNTPMLFDDNNIEDMEKIPAYKRRKMNLNEKVKADKEISRFSLFDNPTEGIQIKGENSFLHDNVD